MDLSSEIDGDGRTGPLGAHEEHDIDDATFLVDGGPWLQTRLERVELQFRHDCYGFRKAIERVKTE